MNNDRLRQLAGVQQLNEASMDVKSLDAMATKIFNDIILPATGNPASKDLLMKKINNAAKLLDDMMQDIMFDRFDEVVKK